MPVAAVGLPGFNNYTPGKMVKRVAMGRQSKVEDAFSYIRKKVSRAYTEEYERNYHFTKAMEVLIKMPSAKDRVKGVFGKNKEVSTERAVERLIKLYDKISRRITLSSEEAQRKEPIVGDKEWMLNSIANKIKELLEGCLGENDKKDALLPVCLLTTVLKGGAYKADLARTGLGAISIPITSGLTTGHVLRGMHDMKHTRERVDRLNDTIFSDKGILKRMELFDKKEIEHMNECMKLVKDINRNRVNRVLAGNIPELKTALVIYLNRNVNSERVALFKAVLLAMYDEQSSRGEGALNVLGEIPLPLQMYNAQALGRLAVALGDFVGENASGILAALGNNASKVADAIHLDAAIDGAILGGEVVFNIAFGFFRLLAEL